MKIGKLLLVLPCSLLFISGCKPSAYIQAAIQNQGNEPVKLVEIDYPSASFGVQQIPPRTIYHYQFKVQGSGNISITFVGNQDKSYTVVGPELRQGDQGIVEVFLDATGSVHWNPVLTHK